MNQDKKVIQKKFNTIKDFFDIAGKLKKEGIVRSSTYSGDIAEFLCSYYFNISLDNSCRNEDYDGIDDKGKKVEIKFHDGEKRKNIIMKDDKKYDYLIVVLGLSSCLKNEKYSEDYLFYKIDKKDFKNVGKTVLKKAKLIKRLGKDLEEKPIEK